VSARGRKEGGEGMSASARVRFVCADAGLRPRGRNCVCADVPIYS
jgi:hypothetical protein